MKTLILITGTATAGKTSLAMMFLNDIVGEKVFSIPSTTHREPRTDDIPGLTKTLSKEEFDRSKFLSLVNPQF